jgi:hypothetical protein
LPVNFYVGHRDKNGAYGRVVNGGIGNFYRELAIIAGRNLGVLVAGSEDNEGKKGKKKSVKPDYWLS